MNNNLRDLSESDRQNEGDSKENKARDKPIIPYDRSYDEERLFKKRFN